MKKIILLSSLIVVSSMACDKSNDIPVDPCFTMTCYNGGICENGHCVCTPGWTGDNCSIQVEPLKILILKISLYRFSSTNSNGVGWDLINGPDVYVKVLKDGVSLYQSPYYENATPTTIYDFLPVSLYLLSVTSYYDIELWDYDFAFGSEYMGGFRFIPYHNQNGFPDYFRCDLGGDLGIDIWFTYNWK